MAQKVNYQPLEETITDNNLFFLRCRHQRQMTVHRFSTNEEGKNGADWEWWFTDAEEKNFFPIRMQAKILNLKSNRFKELHYKNRSGILQRDILEEAAKKARKPILPLYCLYLYQKSNVDRNLSSCFGCSLLALKHVKELYGDQPKPKDGLADVMKNAIPWCSLVCRQESSINLTLPERVRGIYLELMMSSEGENTALEIWSREHVPDHVRHLLGKEATTEDTDHGEAPDKNLAGIVLLREEKE